MKFRHLHIIVALLCLRTTAGSAQITNCTVPLPPILTLVTVRPETGITEFAWTPSPSSEIAAYLIYYYHNENGVPRGDIIDTIWNPAAISYSFNNVSYKYFSSSYVIAAYRMPKVPGLDGCPSPLSNPLNSIYANAVIDSCNRKINVEWNEYLSYPFKVTGYSILLSMNGTALPDTFKVSALQHSYTLNDFKTGVEYCFVVRADLEGGLSSTSNKVCLSAEMQRPPEWINADYATIDGNNNIQLSFTIDPLAETGIYSLGRKTGTADTFQEIARPSAFNGSVLYTDKDADVTVVNYYRLSAINGCRIPVKVSNSASNIVPVLKRDGNDLVITWNPYRTWLGKISSYRLFINTGNGFVEQAVLQPGDTLYRLGYQNIMYDIKGKEVCFYITASEISNPYGIEGSSKSVEICTDMAEAITVPNIFTPNHDLVNDLFRPVLSFTPEDYHLIITNRQGKIIFETRDHQESWDGTSSGVSQPQDVYLWYLKLISPSGKTISRSGTITLLPNTR
jgi:gliding motility-associated-like protein